MSRTTIRSITVEPLNIPLLSLSALGWHELAPEGL